VIAVDSGLWIDVLRGRDGERVRRLRRIQASGALIVITDVIYMELLRGARTAAEIKRLRLLLGQAPILRTSELGDFERAAELYRLARAEGQTVRNTSDCLIAAVCIREQVPLLHDDADFDRLSDVSELQVL
jgi:predicted nucleic acid-binding protein